MPDGAVVKALSFGDRRVSLLATHVTDVGGEALRMARVGCEPVEALYHHRAAPLAVNAPTLELDVDAPAGDCKIPRSTRSPIVARRAPAPAARTSSRFFRRRSTITRANRSAGTPRRVDRATKPGSRKRSRIVLGFCIPSVYTLVQKPEQDRERGRPLVKCSGTTIP